MLDKSVNYKLDMLCLKKPSALDELIESIPKPKDAVPDFGLPKWETMPLEGKIPMVQGPCYFTRGKIGKTLWKSSANVRFNLNDPYCRQIKQNYDSLHDKHLARFFACPRNRKFLLKAGFLTDEFHVKCSLKDYNAYREYLRKLHCDRVVKELRGRCRLREENRILKLTDEEAQKEIAKLRRKQQYLETNKRVFEERDAKEREKHKRWREAADKMNKRLKDIERTKKKERLLRREKREEREKCIRQKVTDATNLWNRRLMETVVERRRKDFERMRNEEIRLAKMREAKRKFAEERWNKRRDCQKKQMENERFLLTRAKEQRQQFLKLYNEKMAKERQRMQRLLKKSKTFVKCYVERHLKSEPDKQRICCKKYLQRAEERKSEVKRLMCSLDPSITLEDLEMFLKEYQGSGDGKILPQDEQFLAVRGNEKRKSAKAIKTKTTSKMDKKEEQRVEEMLGGRIIPEIAHTARTKEFKAAAKSKETEDGERVKSKKCKCELIKALSSK